MVTVPVILFWGPRKVPEYPSKLKSRFVGFLGGAAPLQETYVDLSAAAGIRLQAEGEGITLQQELHLPRREAWAELEQLGGGTGHDGRGDARAGQLEIPLADLIARQFTDQLGAGGTQRDH